MFETLRRNIGWLLAIVLMLFLVTLLAIQSLLLVGMLSRGAGFTPYRGDRIGVMNLSGPIFQVEKQLQILREYEESDSVKAILLQVDSPGGAVGPSQELSEAVARVNETGKPVVVSIRSIGASGAYYVASSADTIVANPGSMVGSIGVIMQFMNVQDLTKKVGIDYTFVKSGEFKDAGSPFKQMTGTEREYFRNLIMDVYDQFLDHILSRRSQLTREELEEMADGRVFTGRQAEQRNLIDVLGTRHEAARIAARAAGMAEPRFINLERRNFSVMESLSEWVKPLTRLVPRQQHGFRLLYMMPGGGRSYE